MLIWSYQYFRWIMERYYGIMQKYFDFLRHLVLGSCCLGKIPKLGEVLSCCSLWRSGANPVASCMATAARKASCPWRSPGPFKRIQLLPFIHFLHCVLHQPKLEFAHLSSPSTLFRWQFLNLLLWITTSFSPLHPSSAFLVDNDEQISLSGWCRHVFCCCEAIGIEPIYSH